MFKESCKIYERYINTPDTKAQQLYYYPQFLGRFICNSDFYIERQDYPSLLLLYTVSGSAVLQYRGEKYRLTPRHFALLDCRDKHIYYPENGCEWEFDFIHFAGQNSFELYAHLYEMNDSPIYEADHEIYDLIKGCITAFSQSEPYREVKTSRQLSDILHICLIHTYNKTVNRFSDVCDFIRRNYAAIPDTSYLAMQYGFSRAYFSVNFKRYVGVTVHEYILCCRIDAAKALLIGNTCSVEQIAQQIGFKDTGTFIRAFKRKEGCTPSRYRKRFS